MNDGNPIMGFFLGVMLALWILMTYLTFKHLDIFSGTLTELQVIIKKEVQDEK